MFTLQPLIPVYEAGLADVLAVKTKGRVNNSSASFIFCNNYY